MKKNLYVHPRGSFCFVFYVRRGYTNAFACQDALKLQFPGMRKTLKPGFQPPPPLFFFLSLKL